MLNLDENVDGECKLELQPNMKKILQFNLTGKLVKH